MLKTVDLVSGYGTVQIIRGINVEIDAGEIVSIIGRNSVGKSTFMKTVIGAVRPMSGQIFSTMKIIQSKRFIRVR